MEKVVEKPSLHNLLLTRIAQSKSRFDCNAGILILRPHSGQTDACSTTSFQPRYASQGGSRSAWSNRIKRFVDGRLPTWLPHQIWQCLQVQMTPESRVVTCNMTKILSRKILTIRMHSLMRVAEMGGISQTVLIFLDYGPQITSVTCIRCGCPWWGRLDQRHCAKWTYFVRLF